MPLQIPAPYIMPWMIRALRFRLPGPIWEADGPAPSVALSFDDGPSRFTPQLLDVLGQENVRASFFTVGSRIQRHPEIIRRAQAAGHLIGLHTCRHTKLTGLSADEIREDLRQSKKILAEVLPGYPDEKGCFFRPPHGAINSEIFKILKEEQVHTVMFGIVPGVQLLPKGWTEKPAQTSRRVLRAAKHGSIIALHDGEYIDGTDNIFDCTQAAETASLLIRSLKAKGFHFVLPQAV